MNKLIIAILSAFSSPEVTAARYAKLELAQGNKKVAQAENLLATMKTQRLEDARRNAAALETALANAATETEKAEIRRQAEITRQNDKTNDVIAALEEAIANARRVNSEKLAKLATKHSSQRRAEEANAQVAEDALALVKAAAGNE